MKKIILILLFFNFLFSKNICSLNLKQINIAKHVYNYSKNFNSKYGINFRNTTTAIYLVETSLGKDNIIGDRFTRTGKIKFLNESSLGLGQIKLLTVLTLLKYNKRLQQKYKYLYHTNIRSFHKYNIYMNKIQYFKSLKNNKKWLRLWKEGKKLKVKKWVNKELKYNLKQLDKYKIEILKDNNIMNLLLTDLDFQIEMSNEWLIFNYDNNIRKKRQHPYLRAISTYNGGLYNYKYIKKVLKSLKIVKCLKRKKILKN